MNEPGNEQKEKFARAEKIINDFLTMQQSSIEAQLAVSQSLNRLCDMGEDFMSIVIKYGMTLDEVIEKYSSKAVAGTTGPMTSFLKEVNNILTNIKSSQEE